MNGKEIAEKLEPWLAKQRRAAWRPIVELGDGPADAPKFCGTPWLEADSDWPECGTCGEPLQSFLQLDLAALPEELGGRFGTGLLQLFYCANLSCDGEGWSPFSDDKSSLVRVVQPHGPNRGGPPPREDPEFPAQRIVGWDRFEDLPDPQELREVGLNYTFDFKADTIRVECPELGFDVTSPTDECQVEEIANSKLGDKLAGWPFWVQGIEYPNCPQCGRRMILVMQLDSEDNIPFMFGDAGCGHITQCPEHKEVVAFGWACG